MTIEGIVKSGFKKGSKYIKIYKEKIKQIINQDIYEGTLNVEVNLIVKNLRFKNFYVIDEFDGFSRVIITPCKINNIDAYIVIPDKTEHKNVFEIISSTPLRKCLKLKDGDKVKIETEIV